MNTIDLNGMVRKPRRVRHSYTQTLNAAPEAVFPLLCPVREIDWAPGWRPDWVISDSGVAEDGCIFQTPGDSTQGQSATWVVTRHDPAAREVEMIKLIPSHTLMRLRASLEPDGKNRTAATITYEYTALGPSGDSFVEDCTGKWYANFMNHWETAMNHYLETGELID